MKDFNRIPELPSTDAGPNSPRSPDVGALVEALWKLAHQFETGWASGDDPGHVVIAKAEQIAKAALSQASQSSPGWREGGSSCTDLGTGSVPLPAREAEQAGVSGVSAAWRRGVMHAVERLDVVLASRLRPNAKLNAISVALSELVELQRRHSPGSYEEAFAICHNDLWAALHPPAGEKP